MKKLFGILIVLVCAVVPLSKAEASSCTDACDRQVVTCQNNCSNDQACMQACVHAWNSCKDNC